MTTESFGKALRVQLAKNWEDKGGARGLLGFLMVVSVAIFPPMLALDLLEVPAFTPQRFIPLLLWLAYLAPGLRNLPAQPVPSSAFFLVLWPLFRSTK